MAKSETPSAGTKAATTDPVVVGVAPAFVTAGSETSKINVRISYRIIELFSQGLYRSPHKAIEELVSNSFDAGATKVHVVISPDLVPAEATIAVIDNGSGMDAKGLEEHWVIGVSSKRDSSRKPPKGRQQIGRFGIGKLATYVLANRLTHVAKVKGKYYATTMDYRVIQPVVGQGIYPEQPVQLGLRQLTEAQARAALSSWLSGSKKGYTELPLFGKGAPASWTVAILSELKEMAREIQRGRLRWILSTAMPIRDDFHLFLDGDGVEAAKLTGKKLKRWRLGKELKDIAKPAPKDLQATTDATLNTSDPHHFGLTHSQLGRVTGYVELYEELLTGGKSSETGRSHGFFVYVRDRLINLDDEYFGIDSNLLRHGTFARFRMVAHIDRLDDELRSSRESIREGPLLEIARNLLHGVFNQARAFHATHEASQAPGVRAAQRIAASPTSLARRPLVALITSALKGDFTPKYSTFPRNLKKKEEEQFVADLGAAAESAEGLVREVKLVDEPSPDGPLAIYNAETRSLHINSLHPFVAHFLDEYGHPSHNVPLELLAMSEVLLEAHLYELGLDASLIHDALNQRDELLRTLSRAAGKRNARLVAQALADASTNKAALENELVAAFDSMGFDEAIKIGGSGKPDGLAIASLGASDAGPQAYSVTLEAKSKEVEGTKVTAKTVGVSTVARQRDAYKAKFAIVAGPDFPTTQGEKSALHQELKADCDNNPGKGITLVRIEDLARLVRLVPAKRVGLHRLRSLFETCRTPEDSKTWIDTLASETMAVPPYAELLAAIDSERQGSPDQPVEYSAISTNLRINKKITLGKADIIELCKALARMAPEFVYAREQYVELTTRPKKVLDAIRATIHEYPEDEQKKIASPK